MSLFNISPKIKSRSQYSIMIFLWDAKKLNIQTCTKYLRVMLDNNLLRDNHVNYITKKISKFVPLLYNVRTKLLNDNLKLVYNALIYPLLIYCNVVWCSCCKTYLCNLNIIQKKLVIVLCLSEIDSNIQHLCSLNITC